MFKKKSVLIFVSQMLICSLAFSQPADSSLLHDDLPVFLTRLGHQLTGIQQGSVASVLLYGRRLSFMTLVVKESPPQVMQHLHRLALFERFTRVGHRVIYDGRIGAFQVQLVLDLGNARETQALLSAVRSAQWEGGVLSQSQIAGEMAGSRRMSIPLPDGGQLLNDICFLEAGRTCYRVYRFPDRNLDDVKARQQRLLKAGEWQRQGNNLGFSTWKKGRKMIQFMLLSVEGQTSLFLATSELDGQE